MDHYSSRSSSDCHGAAANALFRYWLDSQLSLYSPEVNLIRIQFCVSYRHIPAYGEYCRQEYHTDKYCQVTITVTLLKGEPMTGGKGNR